MDENILQSQKIVENLYLKYQDDSYMTNKLNNYLQKQLENTMQNIKNEHEERVNRITGMSIEQDLFINRFIDNNRYYYCNSSELFFKYD